MEQKIRFVNSRFDTQRGIELEDGRIITLMDENEHLYLRYDYILDLENGTFDPDKTAWIDEEGYEKTLNGLHKLGKAKEVKCYDYCDYDEEIYPNELVKNIDEIDEEEYFDILRKKAKEIKKFFSDNGYKVTTDAIMHQLDSWMNDYKSGYRDEANGYHLFSPCGCNTLSVRLSTLNDRCSDWQTTYYC